jgi:hypothetical protein
MFMVHHVVIWIFYKLNVLMQTFFYGCQWLKLLNPY